VTLWLISKRVRGMHPGLLVGASCESEVVALAEGLNALKAAGFSLPREAFDITRLESPEELRLPSQWAPLDPYVLLKIGALRWVEGIRCPACGRADGNRVFYYPLRSRFYCDRCEPGLLSKVAGSWTHLDACRSCGVYRPLTRNPLKPRFYRLCSFCFRAAKRREEARERRRKARSLRLKAEELAREALVLKQQVAGLERRLKLLRESEEKPPEGVVKDLERERRNLRAKVKLKEEHIRSLEREAKALEREAEVLEKKADELVKRAKSRGKSAKGR